jgi:uncharacterized protein (TIGR02271 family)
MPNTQEVTDWKGQKLVDQDGHKIGTVDEVYVDAETGRPEWLAVSKDLFGSRVSFVPLADAQRDGDDIRVPYTKDQVKDSPNADADGALSEDEESRLYRHYGLDYSERRSDSGLPEGGTDRGVSGAGAEVRDDAMTRSEEELSVGTREVETGRARLRKYVVTEEVTKTVPVQREEVRIEREPITDADRDDALAGGDITEQEHEVTLRAEEPVVEKRTVPKERVRLETDTVTDERQVTDEVRKERIETEGDVRRGD